MWTLQGWKMLSARLLQFTYLPSLFWGCPQCLCPKLQKTWIFFKHLSLWKIICHCFRIYCTYMFGFQSLTIKIHNVFQNNRRVWKILAGENIFGWELWFTRNRRCGSMCSWGINQESHVIFCHPSMGDWHEINFRKQNRQYIQLQSVISDTYINSVHPNTISYIGWCNY